jgi:hypothetical protein
LLAADAAAPRAYTRTPSLTVVLPLKALAPERVMTPVPFLISAPEPLITPE